MGSVFSLIVEDFADELASIELIVNIGSSKEGTRRARVASINASTLLLAASFEEFVRQIAREHAIQVVRSARSIGDLPQSLLEAAWKRTFSELARGKQTGKGAQKEGFLSSAKSARPKIDALFAFVEGDLSQDVFSDLIQNENNMRPEQINSLFKLSGLKNTCMVVCDKKMLMDFFGSETKEDTHKTLTSEIEDFFWRRNEIAHSLNSAKSSGPDQIKRDIEMFRAFSIALCKTLEDMSRQSLSCRSNEDVQASNKQEA
jgi:hypothetical protein